MSTGDVEPAFYIHLESGIVAELAARRDGDLILRHPRWGECRWLPARARKLRVGEVKQFRYCKNGHEQWISGETKRFPPYCAPCAQDERSRQEQQRLAEFAATYSPSRKELVT